MAGTNFNAKINLLVSISLTNEFDKAVAVECNGDPTSVATESGIYTNGCLLRRTDIGTGVALYQNTGTITSPTWTAITGGGGGGNVSGAGSANFITYWTGANTVGGSTDFQFNSSTNQFIVSSLGNRTLAIDPGSNFYGLGDLDGIGQGGRLIIADAVGSKALSLITGGDVIRLDLDGVNGTAKLGDTTSVGNDTRIIIDDANIRTDHYAQDIYFRGYNNNIVLFSEITNTYADITIGDGSSAYGGTRLSVRSSDGKITATTSALFEVVEPATSEIIFAVDPVNIVVAGGDTLLTHNGFRFAIFDTPKIMDFASPMGLARFGDADSSGNGTLLTINDDLQTIKSTITVPGVSVSDLTLSSTDVRLTFLNNTGSGTAIGGDFQAYINSSASNGDPFAGTTYDYTLSGGVGIITSLNDNNGASDTYRADQIFTATDITTKFTDLTTGEIGGFVADSIGLRILGAFGAETVTMFTAGGNITIDDGVSGLIYNPAALQANATITLPSAPREGQYCEIFFGGTITSGNAVVTTLTIAPNGGQTLVQSSAPTSAVAGDYIKYKWRGSNSRWYRAS